ncbi:hypothetical protein PQO01_20705 [Lentisphaera marina]|uniref:hypothetical protein n=1 Tax=Lentisphaera marina TaxID=1111041 RepID=UPI002364FF4A|nr:hypothetical protein [Lentisphaera marina]MDD7987380.1 hypothetical protein [Lentisphaera marina]
MNVIKIKILSYIRNMRKIIFACPLCSENNSLIHDELNDAAILIDFKCPNCARSFRGDFSALTELEQHFHGKK